MLKDRKLDFIAEKRKREQYFKMKHSHFHPYYEIYYLYSGKRRIFVDDTIYDLRRGDMILIQKNVLHRTTYVSDETHERFVLNFTDKYLAPLFETYSKELILSCFQKPFFTVPLNRREYVDELFQKLTFESGHLDHFSEHLIHGYLQELVIFLIRCQKNEAQSQIPANLTDEVIQNTARYIRSNYNQPITLEMAASFANMSSTYFSKKFKLVTGFGFKEYLCKIRLTEACSRLLETNDSITEIAFACGFTDSNYFGDVFKKLKGVSPLQYRKMHEAV
ncbi:helix-turn-helix transcriptional regulator [Konateibacter massiliensis]|uniref:helix-turn-helix transcriptional regulator n=1 Tax=Konateibacter massiliensis TaxID=2002841 RepID=UPI000C14B40D|nr:AraC family transcriptional regulator [Konateibacter massiliensis]